MKGLYIIFLVCSWTSLLSQVEADSLSTTSDAVEVIIADNFVKISNDSIDVDSLRGNIILRQDSVYMYCDFATLTDSKYVLAYGNVVIIQHDTIKAFCDTLRYSGDDKVAHLKQNVVLENGQEILSTSALVYDTNTKVGKYNSGGRLIKEESTLTSVKGTYYVAERKAIFTDNVQVVDSILTLRTSFLDYDLNQEKAKFEGPTRVTKEDTEIYCEEGFYLIEEKKATFKTNAQYRNEESIATAESMFYDGAIEEIVLQGEARYQEGDLRASAHQIVYRDEDEIFTLVGDGIYKDSERELKSDFIQYNRKTEALETRGGAEVVSDDGSLDSETIETDEQGRTVARGEVIWTSKDGEQILESDAVILGDSTAQTKAFGETQRPLMKIFMDTDSIHLSADTLITTEVVVGSDTSSLFIADNRVELIAEDFRLICDSLVMNEKDSIFSLFQSPVVWSDTTQFSGDTIFIYMKEGSVRELQIKNNSIIITESFEGVYDQIQGKFIDAYFTKGSIETLDVKDNAQSIYFLKDDEQKFIGVNENSCKEMTFTFVDDELQDINCSQDGSNFTPMEKAKPLSLRLPNFNWNPLKRPISVETIREIIYEN